MTVTAATARGNALLDALDDADLDSLLPLLSEVDLPVGAVLQKPGKALDSVLFPIQGVVSLVVELEDDATVEAATIGREGVLGLSVYLGTAAPTERATVLVAGRGLSMPATEFAGQVRIIDGPFEQTLRRHAAAMFSQLARNAACNRVHSVRQRAARWLLMTADRTDDSRFALTQDFLAQVLAVRRASVNEVAQALAEDGAITYTRGTITVLDRIRLESTACSCYAVIARTTGVRRHQTGMRERPVAAPVEHGPVSVHAAHRQGS